MISPAAVSHTRHPISIAPMIDKTNRDWRWIMRRITRKTLLYTEMVSAPAVLRGNRKKILGFDASEKPLVMQLGWDTAAELSEACKIAEDFGYDEINLNCGCPSSKVQNHGFGACLMQNPEHVASLVDAMAAAVKVPITVKARIGIQSIKRGIQLERYEDLHRFTQTVAEAGCRKFVVHARIAVLDGLSPRQNRSVPPLRPEDVFRLKKDFPYLFIEINGGYRESEPVMAALEQVDAVMLGRIALDNPYFLAGADQRWFETPGPIPSRLEILEAAIPYLVRRAEEGAPIGGLIQPLLNLFAGCRGSKKWKRGLSDLPASGCKHLDAGLKAVAAEMNPDVLASNIVTPS